MVYTVLHALERDGALKSRRKTVDGRSRIYYAVTASGLKRYRDLAQSWTTPAGAIHSMIKGGRHATTV